MSKHPLSRPTCGARIAGTVIQGASSPIDFLL